MLRGSVGVSPVKEIEDRSEKPKTDLACEGARKGDGINGGKWGNLGKLWKERKMEGCWKDGIEKKRKHIVHEYVIVLNSFMI